MSAKHTTTTRTCEHCGKAVTGRGRLCSPECAVAARTRPAAERFWFFVRKTESCWLWTGSKFHNGYGSFWTPAKPTVRAHRFSWELHHGPVPAGLSVLHNCPDGDNPSCVNPDHLFLGTQADNGADMVAKGRSATGERCARSKLTAEIVRDARSRFRAGLVTVPMLCAELPQVDKETIRAAVKGRTWKDV